MKAMLIDNEKNLVWSEVEYPTVQSRDVLIEIYAAALNRADLLQRQGTIPAPRAALPGWVWRLQVRSSK